MLTTQRALRTAADFESIYADAHGDPTHIPWVDLRPHPALVAWLNAVAPSIVRCKRWRKALQGRASSSPSSNPFRRRGPATTRGGCTMGAGRSQNA